VTQIVVSMVGKNNVSGIAKAEDLFYVPEHPVKDASGKLWLAISVKDGSLLDYEKINPSYVVTLTVNDRGGVTGSNTVAVLCTLVVNDVNEAPEITGVRGLNDGFTGTTREEFTLYPKETWARMPRLALSRLKILIPRMLRSTAILSIELFLMPLIRFRSQ
jgi:hypothetical protein